MAADFVKKVADTRPIIQGTLTDGAGAAVNVTGATIVLATKHQESGSTAAFTGAIVTATSGIVNYTFAASELDTVGFYDAEWQVTFSAGVVNSYPNTGYFLIQVVDDLN